MTRSYKEYSKTKQKEYFYKGALKYELRARSYYKLKHIDEKFSIFKNNMCVVDLGCAPGGWLQYLESVITSGEIIGVDLLPIQKTHEFSNRVTLYEEDFNEISSHLPKNIDVVVSDMAPEFSGDSKTDRGRTHKLNLEVLDFCDTHLKKGGYCVFKTFGGEDLEFVRKIAKKKFSSIKEFKPSSSQQKSAELYIVCFSKL